MLKGSLEHFALADIFRLISWAKKTGKIDIARSAGLGKVFFRDGEVYYAESSLSREPLGQKLIRSGMLSEVNLRRALEQNSRSGDMIGQILLANGWVTEHQLQTALKQQIEDCVFDMLSSNEGSFEFTPGVVADIDVQIAVSVENLIMEASRRLDEMELIKRRIPSVNTVLRMAAQPPEGAAEINITAEEWRMLVLVDGHRTVGEIAQAVGKDSFGALRSLYGLVNSGLVEVVPEHETALAGQTVEPRISISPQPPRVAPGPVGDDAPVVEHVSFDDASAGAPDAGQVPAARQISLEPDEETTGPPSGDVPVEAPAASEPMSAPPVPKGRILYADEGPIFKPAEDAVPSPPPAAGPVPAQAATSPAEPETQVDRSTVVRELAGLFSDEEFKPAPAPASRSGENRDDRQRVEDDESVDKKLISKLIDGVKGL